MINFFKKVFLLPVMLYQKTISPLTSKACIFVPSCSQYFNICVNKFGIIKGSYLGFKRIARCNPGSKGGKDYVPQNLKGDFKWLI